MDPHNKTAVMTCWIHTKKYFLIVRNLKVDTKRPLIYSAGSVFNERSI